MSTSNGTKAILAAQKGGADPTLIASFLNLSAVARRAWQEMSEKEKNLTVICSGSHGKPSRGFCLCRGPNQGSPHIGRGKADFAGCNGPARRRNLRRLPGEHVGNYRSVAPRPGPNVNGFRRGPAPRRSDRFSRSRTYI